MNTAEPQTERPHADPPRLRADATENRNRILDVARAAFAERGLDVPMAAIARRAEVGVATLYRRFPTKDALITEVFADQISACTSVIDEALADPDPWHGFQNAVTTMCEMQAEDLGLTSAFLTAFPEAVDFERQRSHVEQGLAELVRRAQDDGRLRPDFMVSDLILVFLAGNGVATGASEASRAASRRVVAYLLSSFHTDRVDPHTPLPPPAPLDIGHIARLITR
ncbi:TetR/AcrR family transcriptional regulator [Actinoalloteichus hymeniacidonis]|uniref:Transcriptional regulator, TetR family n=1 Tax=Actinoalloteichus hymeniacidonis TaxID=340345 RepID=A0AAC9HQS6_9PSEU|nr:TetR/AcrR family transcriptional regulator [Actinoalloteichus hymeniacidonis]AOS63623.1 transcriptional regulator, TetR family [Actinoalloteichus hymeniacidonis]MBB5908329.1 AcrR family transcriptional regulator [Actinoalloteichus hymeniacidonis]